MATAAGDDDAQMLGPELIMVAHRDAQLRLHAGRAHVAASDIAPLNRALEETSVAPGHSVSCIRRGSQAIAA